MTITEDPDTTVTLWSSYRFYPTIKLEFTDALHKRRWLTSLENCIRLYNNTYCIQVRNDKLYVFFLRLQPFCLSHLIKWHPFSTAVGFQVSESGLTWLSCVTPIPTTPRLDQHDAPLTATKFWSQRLLTIQLGRDVKHPLITNATWSRLSLLNFTPCCVALGDL